MSKKKVIEPASEKRTPLSAGMIILGTIGIVALAVFGFSSFYDDMRAGQILKLIDHLKKACEQYYFDLGAFAMEYSDVAYSTYLAHNLSRPTGSEQWNGPYIRNLLTNYDNPFGGPTRIYNYIDYANGFDLDSDDVIDTRGDGNFIVFLGVPLHIAKKINDRVDGGKETENWMTSGKVKYSQKAGSLSVYLIGG